MGHMCNINCISAQLCTSNIPSGLGIAASNAIKSRAVLVDLWPSQNSNYGISSKGESYYWKDSIKLLKAWIIIISSCW